MTDKSIRRRPSMMDVAARAGVSPQTVSRVSNGEPYVSKAKRAAVLKAMGELGYRPNSAARAMKRGAFKVIGVMFQSLHPVGNHRTLEAISEVTIGHEYATMLMPVGSFTQQATGGAFTRLGEMGVDAVIAVLPSHMEGAENLELPPSLPTVVLGTNPLPQASVLDFDQVAGTLQVMEHLFGLGHTTVHHIAGPEESLSVTKRRAVWQRALEETGRPVPPPVAGDWSPASGYAAMKVLLGRTPIPTAVFVANDQMALGAYRAILESGLRIPQDISVVGFDNVDEAVAFPTPLTTVRQDWEQLGREAIRCTLALIDGEAPVTIALPTTMVLRSSTAPAPR